MFTRIILASMLVISCYAAAYPSSFASSGFGSWDSYGSGYGSAYGSGSGSFAERSGSGMELPSSWFMDDGSGSGSGMNRADCSHKVEIIS